jgi:hypothetical protein
MAKPATPPTTPVRVARNQREILGEEATGVIEEGLVKRVQTVLVSAHATWR